jgi:hypothetical protein
MIEAGGQVGYDRPWAWCASVDGTDHCGVVPARASLAGVLGVVVVARAEPVHLSLGLDALLRWPAAPDECGPSGCTGAAIGTGRVGLQAWLEAGWGGVSW